MNYFSHDGVDRWIHENLNLPEDGVYVDVGCAHPDQYSNTSFLRQIGWTGLAIDGTPEYAWEWEMAARVKFINAVLSDKPEVRFLNEKTNALVSRIHDEGQSVAARKLTDILDEEKISHVDFLSIDIEGHEKEVLTDLFTRKIYPRILVAEYNSEHKGRDPELIALIISHGYEFAYMTNENGVFVNAV